MHDGRSAGPVITTIDRRGVIKSCNRMQPSVAAEGLTVKDVIGTSVLKRRERWGEADEEAWENISRCLLRREERRYRTVVTTPGGNRFSVHIHAVPAHKGAVLIGYDEHHGLPLEPAEIEVLQLISEGLTHAQAAHRLRMSESSSKRHMENARRKLGARSGTHAVALGLRRGIIQ